MKTMAKLSLGALMLAGAATAMAAPAQAQVSFGIGIGPSYGYYGRPYYRSYSCDPYSRWYDPYYCGSYAPGYVYGPSFYYTFRDNWGGYRGNYRGYSNYGYRGGNNFRGGGNFRGGAGFNGGHHR